MRISIRRCLSMLRNTVYGNELAMPATNAYRRDIVSVAYTVQLAAHALVCRGPRLGAALAFLATFYSAAPLP